MKNFNVHLTAYGNPNEVRVVNVEENELTDTLDDLNLIFKYGQNDFQSKNQPSVSAGDVIEYKDILYLVQGIGFVEISKNSFEVFKKLSRIDRLMYAMSKGLDDGI